MVSTLKRRPSVPLNSAQSMTIDGRLSETFVITMGTSVSFVGVRNLITGQLYVMVLKQDQNGNHSFNWGNAMQNGTTPDPTPFSITVQCFVALSPIQLSAVPVGTWN